MDLFIRTYDIVLTVAQNQHTSTWYIPPRSQSLAVERDIVTVNIDNFLHCVYGVYVCSVYAVCVVGKCMYVCV